MADESLFILKGLKQVRVKCPFRDVIENLDFLIQIALTDDATIALGDVYKRQISSEALMLASKQYCGISNGSACNSHDYSARR